MRKNPPRAYIFLILALSAIGSVFGQSHDVGVQGIIKQWAAIEECFVETNFINNQQEAQNSILEEVDEFLNAIQSFLDSETFRIYRLIPFSPSNEIAEIQKAAALAPAFRQAVLNAIETILRGEKSISGEHTTKINESSSVYNQFTKREMEILNLIKQDKTNQQIAGALAISVRTVENHISNIYFKTGKETRLELSKL